MSSGQFSPEPPWPKFDRRDDNFETAGPEEVRKDFEPQAWEPPVEIVPTEIISSEPEGSVELEDDLAEPIVEDTAPGGFRPLGRILTLDDLP